MEFVNGKDRVPVDADRWYFFKAGDLRRIGSCSNIEAMSHFSDNILWIDEDADGWIPVEPGKSPTPGPVLFCTNEDVVFAGAYVENPNNRCYLAFTSMGVEHIDPATITHWRLFPLKPINGQKAVTG